MGIIRAHLRLANDAKPELEEIDADALVDTGALHLCIPEHVAMQLQLRTVETRELILANGKPHQVPYVSPVRIELLGRHSVCGALVLGKEVTARGNPDRRHGSDCRTRASQGIGQSTSTQYSDVGGNGKSGEMKLADSRPVMGLLRNTLKQRPPRPHSHFPVPPSALPTPRRAHPATACREA